LGTDSNNINEIESQNISLLKINFRGIIFLFLMIIHISGWLE